MKTWSLFLGFPGESPSSSAPRITFELSDTQDCRMWCDAWVTFARALGDLTRDGDLYEIAIRRPGHASPKRLRDTARYDVRNAGCPDECHTYSSDHSAEPPWTVE